MSVSSFAEGDALCRRLEDAGLERVTRRPLTGGVATLYEGLRPLAVGSSKEEE
jgi:hypothetical protein